MSIMTVTSVENTPLFQVRAEVAISATPEQVYAVISDLPRSGEWSEECTGGEWVSGTPATVGAVFRGVNERSPDVVAWAPVVRGTWTTEAEIIAAQPGRTFRWSMRDSTGKRQDSIWSFDIEPAGSGATLVHHFRMGEPTEGIKGITAEMNADQKRQFFDEWGAKLAGDLAATLERIKAVIEN